MAIPIAPWPTDESGVITEGMARGAQVLGYSPALTVVESMKPVRGKHSGLYHVFARSGPIAGTSLYTFYSKGAATRFMNFRQRKHHEVFIRATPTISTGSKTGSKRRSRSPTSSATAVKDKSDIIKGDTSINGNKYIFGRPKSTSLECGWANFGHPKRGRKVTL
jgi:hypothetical protein